MTCISAPVCGKMQMGDIMAMPKAKDLSAMSKDEILQAIADENAKRNAAIRNRQWRKAVVLTLAEGAKLESEILPLYNCQNVSQLVKKIVNGQLSVSENPEN